MNLALGRAAQDLDDALGPRLQTPAVVYVWKTSLEEVPRLPAALERHARD